MRQERSTRHGWGVRQISKTQDGEEVSCPIYERVYQGGLDTEFSTLLFFRTKKMALEWIKENKLFFHPKGKLVPHQICIRVYADW